ncbi:putative bifunctional diguanylate cyclase/phosphodiesterase [Nitrogeniibacter aestuarii]|uniref:putative bifunctional diguanylate cyclase/phosphodiesterase n=1 Tax=Nitrogeniibacter aestuarii TaxID=2815343 RepID=UPI001D10C714|nr:bifunctional diguanylate cyclase/phosphodiesterase [Nitrogeniibacter aestuarii]
MTQSSRNAPLDALRHDASTLLLALFDNALVGVYVIQDGLFAYVNETLARLFGYTQDEVCGRLGPLDLTDADTREHAAREIDKRVRGEVRASFYGFKGTRKDGSTFDTEVFGVATEFQGRPAIIGILMDVSKRVHAEKEAADQLAFIRGLVETIPNPVFYKDATGEYLGCNKAFEAFLGASRESFVGKSVFDLSPKELAERYHAADQALFDAPGTQTYEAQVKSADGSYRDVIFNKATFNRADGELGGLVGVILDITERKELEARIRQDAYFDSLTGLPNRRLFEDRVGEAFKLAKRHHTKLALLFIDLDRFKEVNDTQGHHIGDQLLIEAGQRIGSCLRESDTVARWSGDEFIVALSDVSDAGDATRVVEEVIGQISRPFHLSGQFAQVTASVGLAMYPDDCDNIEALLSCADQGMYAAKSAGRNGYCQFVPARQAAARARRDLAIDLRDALSRHEFHLHYQPIIDLKSGHIVKAEALLRWNHPSLGNVPPDRFIPLAEEMGLIGPIGDWVFQQACQDVMRWNQQRPAEHAMVQVSLNKSPRQILEGTSEVHWLDYLNDLGVPADYLNIEITEGLLLDASDEVFRKLDIFRRAGVEISLDDFGTGYSAMSYLKTFAIDNIKIDRSFVQDMLSSPSDQAIVEAVIAMAHKLGVRVVAEGIESEDHRALLIREQCDFGQGFLIGRPMPVAEFMARIQADAPARQVPRFEI